ncbi:uncharacterized protein LOC114336200 [Diabrotica virgifera virgifera]|uniref:Uncharacterized protein LOC114336200 n=1 Tax=Diabrotica virgifera virgifera TaxID=50390 RepID=A0A6P7GBW7_DIAVI|nr:uncharacterized protein LOC114336200 [Diabrotica virgifera virgifera]
MKLIFVLLFVLTLGILCWMNTLWSDISTVTNVELLDDDYEESASFSNGSRCSDCKIIVEQASKVLKSGLNNSQITAIGNLACNLAPPLAKRICKGKIRDVYNYIYSSIVSKGDSPATTCKRAGFC